MKVWIAEWFDYDGYKRMGIFDTEFKAFISCLKDYQKNKINAIEYINIYMELKPTFMSRYKKEVIKDLRRYQISEEEVL